MQWQLPFVIILMLIVVFTDFPARVDAGLFGAQVGLLVGQIVDAVKSCRK